MHFGAGETAPSKAAASLAGRPLVAYPLEALAEVCDRVAVVCKRDTALPEIGAAERWNEPEEPRHPLTGIIHALERAGGPVLVCGADMPFVTASACRELIAVARTTARDATTATTASAVSAATADVAWREEKASAPAGLSRGASATAVVATADGGLEPLLGVYAPRALPTLRAARADAPLRTTVAALDPVRVPQLAGVVRSVNTPEELAAAAAELRADRARTG